MSLYREYRNARIKFDDHMDLINNDPAFKRTCNVLDEYMNNLKKRFQDEAISEDSTIFIRVAPSSAITIYIGISKENNPYIFMYDALQNIISRDIPYNEFSKIGETPYIYMLEDFIKATNIGKFKLFENDTIKKQILTLVDEYDQSIKLKQENTQNKDREDSHSL